MIAAVWLACATEPSRDAPPPDPTSESALPPVECPPLDWAVHVSGLISDAMHHVVALPGGDLLVTGNVTGGAHLGTGRDDLVYQVTTRARGVARLGPDGRARWLHAIGSGAQVGMGIGVTAGAVWVAGSQSPGTLEVDNEPVPGAPVDADALEDGFAARFDLETGELDRLVYVGGPGYQRALAVAEDDDANVYVTGTYKAAGLDLGGGFALPGPPPEEGDWAWLASWDPAGRVRWLTGAPGSQGLGLAVKGDTLLWNVLGTDHGWIRPDGTTTTFDRPDDAPPHLMYPVDRMTGAPGAARRDLVELNASF